MDTPRAAAAAPPSEKRPSDTENSAEKGPHQHHKKCRKKPGGYFCGNAGAAHLPVMMDPQGAGDPQYRPKYQGTIQGRKERGGELLPRLLHFRDPGLGGRAGSHKTKADDRGKTYPAHS
jgi:hypothetical protein